MNLAERRAAEHAARKAAYKAAKLAMPPAVTETPDPAVDPVVQIMEEPKKSEFMPISAAKLAANRQNAKLSTGPQSEASKTKVSLNALKTGLTGRTVLLPFGEAPAYEALLLSYQKECAPIGPVETVSSNP